MSEWLQVKNLEMLVSKSELNLDINKNSDILLFGKESAGVPSEVHKSVNFRLKIPINKKTRSLNQALSVAIASSEALRQINKK